MSQFQSLLFAGGARNDVQGKRVSTDFNGSTSYINSNLSNSYENALGSSVSGADQGNNNVENPVQYFNQLDSKIQGSRLKFNGKHELTVSIHDAVTSQENVLVDINAIPGAKEGDFAILYKKVPKDKKNQMLSKTASHKDRRRLIFQLRQMDNLLIRKLNNKFQISVLNNSLPLYLNINKSSQAYVKPINPEMYQIDLIEIYIKDIYLSRGDMWVLSNYIVNNFSYCYVQQNLIIFNSINLTVSKIYIQNANVFSGIINSKSTKIIFRSKSSKLTFLIQLSSDMFHFDVTGGILYNKIINSLLPSIFQHWLEMGTNHLITVILFTSIVDNNDEQLSACPAGVTFKNAKDYYRIVVDQININHWSKIMINLRYEILKFKQDIQLIYKQMLPAVKGNLLQALNLSTVLMLNNVNNLTSLRHTQNHFILISPNSGLYDIDYGLFDKIVKKILKLDISVDLVCLGATPLHHTPMFRYRNLNNKLVYRFPTWFNCYFWIHNHFVNSFSVALNVTKDALPTLTPDPSSLNDDEELCKPSQLRCKLYELQMMGVMEYEMSGLQIPHLPKDLGKIATIKDYIAKYDDQAFRSSYIDVDETEIDEWILQVFANKDGNSEGTKKLSDIKKVKLSKPKSKKNDNSLLSSKPLMTKQSLVFVPDKENLLALNSYHGLRAAAHSTVLVDEIAGVTNQINASAYSTLKENQKAFHQTAKDDACSVVSATSNEALSRSSLRNHSVDDISFKLSKSYSHTERRPENSSELTLQLVPQNQSRPPLQNQKQSTFRSFSVKLFQALGHHNLTSSLVESSKTNGTRPDDEFSIVSLPRSKRQEPQHHFQRLNKSFYQKAPALKTALSTSSITTGNVSNFSKSKLKELSKGLSTRYELKNTKDKLAPLPTVLKSNSTLDVGSKKALVRSFNNVALPADKGRHLGILIENPMRLSETNLDFNSINFGKWANIYPVHNGFSSTENAEKTLVFKNDGSKTIAPASALAANNVPVDRFKSKKKKNLISWKSLICPASLPTTTNEFPALDSMKYEYSITNYEIFPNSQFRDVLDAKDLFKEMIYVRLMMGYQICSASSNRLVKKFENQENGIFQSNIDLISYYLPKDFEQSHFREASFNPIVYLMLTDEVHRIFLDFYGNIRVRIYKKVEDSYNEDDAGDLDKDDNYRPFVRTRYDTCYKQVEIDSSAFSISNFNWNKIDYYLAGNFDEKHADFMYDENDRINVFQIRLVVMQDVKKASENTDDSLVTGECVHFENLKSFLRSIQRDEYKGSFNDTESTKGEGERMKTMLIDIDPNNRSHKPEILKIYYDDLSQNVYPNTGYSYDSNCYHIKLQWLTTTPKLVDDLITKWTHTCERYSLKLVEVPTYEAYKTPKINPFHSYINIKLSYSPWDHIDKYFEKEGLNKYYYHNYLLQASDFYLDDGNSKFLEGSKVDSDATYRLLKNQDDNDDVNYDDDVNRVFGKEIRVGNEEQDFHYVQYIHKSGAYLAELKENGEFFLAPNNIFIARINLKKQAIRKIQKNKLMEKGNGNINNKRNSTSDSFVNENLINTTSFYSSEKDYLADYTNYQTSKVSDEDDYFFDSQSIMIKFLERCSNNEFLKKTFDEAKQMVSK